RSAGNLVAIIAVDAPFLHSLHLGEICESRVIGGDRWRVTGGTDRGAVLVVPAEIPADSFVAMPVSSVHEITVGGICCRPRVGTGCPLPIDLLVTVHTVIGSGRSGARLHPRIIILILAGQRG